LERKLILLPEAKPEMEKETIIFFDKLGFGWVLDKMMVKEMKLNHFSDYCSAPRSLFQILENLFDNSVI
jgi:hypothetical protein